MAESNTMNPMVDAMLRNGLRMTDQRRTLAQIFFDRDRYFSPMDVYDRMKMLYPNLSFDTVYRNLRILCDLGILEKFYSLDGAVKFKRCCLTHHHHHAICLHCGKTTPFDYCPMDRPFEMPSNFKVVDHRFEIYGVCERCQCGQGE